MPGPDKYDPIADLSTTKSMGDHNAPSTPESGAGRTNAESFDGTANFGTDGHDIVIGNPNVVSGLSGQQRTPAGVDRFDGMGGLASAPFHQDDYDASEDK